MSKIKDLYKPNAGSDLDLSPCPFCGGTEVVYFVREHIVGDRFGVLCCDCLASIDPGWAQQRSVVQAMWNHRKIVRCKDCKHRGSRLDKDGGVHIACYKMSDDDFCSYGEHR